MKKIAEIHLRDEFASWKESIDKTNHLSDLFTLWQNAQRREINPEETFPICPSTKKYPDDPRAFQTSFCIDGVTSLQGHVDSKTAEPAVSVLFILKESNNRGMATTPEASGFWFNEKTDAPAREHYRQNLARALQTLPHIGSLAQPFGYINLNKRGGFGQTTDQQLKQYVAKYRHFIKRQIILHDPHYVIFCGCYDHVAHLLFETAPTLRKKHPINITLNGHTTTLSYVYHPSCQSSRFYQSLQSFNP